MKMLSLFIHSHVNPNPYDIVELLGQYTYFFYTLKVNGDQNAKKMSTMTNQLFWQIRTVHQLLLQFSESYDPSEIILIYWFITVGNNFSV